MTANAIEVHGTLREDGTLVLDERPNLPPGRVKVTVEPAIDYTKTSAWQFFQRIKAEREALGITPTSQEEIDSYLAAMRDDDERSEAK